MSTGKTIIAGPCVIESAELLDTVAQRLVDINRLLGTDIIFKASFDKANRTSIHSFRGPGLEHGLEMLADVKARYGLRVSARSPQVTTGVDEAIVDGKDKVATKVLINNQVYIIRGDKVYSIDGQLVK
jgi:3-deoxy-D-manno-octulosonic acid (KDO) 8-phosphate synthase